MSTPSSSLPRLAVTPGDPGGVGPEILAAALSAPGLAERVELVVVDRSGGGEHPPRPTAEGGQASLAAFEEAVALALSGDVDGIVTGPIDKRSLALAGCRLPGHTAILRERTGSSSIRMMMVAPEKLRVILVTDHVPLSEVSRRVTRSEVRETLVAARSGLVRELDIRAPRIALLGLNPHCGDDGVLGREDQETLLPAVEECRARGVDVTGPFPADGFFGARSHEDYDAVVATYHDQGLVPVKLLGGGRTIGVTLGLPFVRTSVGHGTAFDKVGRADPTSLLEAIQMAQSLVRIRRNLSLSQGRNE